MTTPAETPTPGPEREDACHVRRTVTVMLPAQLRTLAHVDHEVRIPVAAEGADATGRLTQRALLDALERDYPMLRGTIRDHVTRRRRPYLRFFACGEDLSHEAPDAPLPPAVAAGDEPFLIVGSVAGG